MRAPIEGAPVDMRQKLAAAFVKESTRDVASPPPWNLLRIDQRSDYMRRSVRSLEAARRHSDAKRDGRARVA